MENNFLPLSLFVPHIHKSYINIENIKKNYLTSPIIKSKKFFQKKYNLRNKKKKNIPFATSTKEELSEFVYLENDDSHYFSDENEDFSSDDIDSYFSCENDDEFSDNNIKIDKKKSYISSEKLQESDSTNNTSKSDDNKLKTWNHIIQQKNNFYNRKVSLNNYPSSYFPSLYNITRTLAYMHFNNLSQYSFSQKIGISATKLSNYLNIVHRYKTWNEVENKLNSFFFNSNFL